MSPNFHGHWDICPHVSATLAEHWPLPKFLKKGVWLDWPSQGGTFVDLLWYFLSCVCYVIVRVCLYVICGHLLGKADLLALVCGVLTELSLSNWYPGSGVVLDCIDSRYLHPCLLWNCGILILFDLILYIPSTIFQLNRDESSWVEPVLSYDKCVLLKDHNAVTPARHWSRIFSVTIHWNEPVMDVAMPKTFDR